MEEVMGDEPALEVKVWGDMACFTRPEMKAERVSYDVMTPSAARGVLEAIFWKPEIHWLIREIEVLRPIRRMSILRNEVDQVVPSTIEASAAKGKGRWTIEAQRTQRHALILRDVAYIIRADVHVRQGAGEVAAKYRDQFRRRVESGQCLWTPYLGCREFSAYFDKPDGTEQAIKESNPLGRMLLDMRYTHRDYATREKDRRSKDFGKGSPVFFNAALDQGVMRIPPNIYIDQEIIKR
jgi:CRISPR-associated protein Cas5d